MKQKQKHTNLNEDYTLTADTMNLVLLVQTKDKDGVLTGVILSLFETKDVETSESIWYAVVNTEQLDQTVEIPISRLLGVAK